MSLNENPSAVSEAAKAKALELANAASCDCRWTYTDLTSSPALSALVQYVQEVSNAAKAAVANVAKYPGVAEECLAPFILPEPVDPIEVEAEAILLNAGYERLHTAEHQLVRKALRRGIELGRAST